MSQKWIENARQIQELKRLAMANHDVRTDGKVTTAAMCVCGGAMGGPAGSDACKALKSIKELAEFLDFKLLLKGEELDASKLPRHIQDTIEALTVSL